MEIKVNEYVRTEDGLIGKVEQINKEPTEDNVFYICTDAFDGLLDEIVKHSLNIIDLIEEGDYVNGKGVVYDASESEMYNGHKTIGVSISNDNSTTWTILDTEIRDIVTKQQFNQMKYIVGDE